MPALDPMTYGWVQVSAISHSNARNATAGDSNSSEPSTTQTGFGYQMQVSGRTQVFTIRRLFISFKTTEITQSLSSANVAIPGAAANSKQSILVPSTAFGGTNQTITNSDFNNLSFNTTYNNGLSTWVNGTNTYTLNSDALSDITNNNYFIVAIIQFDNDYDNTALTGRGGIINFSTNFGGSIKLNYTTGGGSVTAQKVTGIEKANIGRVTGIQWSGISKITGQTRPS